MNPVEIAEVKEAARVFLLKTWREISQSILSEPTTPTDEYRQAFVSGFMAGVIWMCKRYEKPS